MDCICYNIRQHKNTTKKIGLVSSVGSMKRDLVTYATQKQSQQETVQFTKWYVLHSPLIFFCF